MSSSIENIVKALGAKRFGDHNAQIDWILTDSRSLCFPEETLFFALKTKRNDGHKYLSELYERGVRNFVVGELPADMQSFQDANFLQLTNPLKGLQKLAEKQIRETVSGIRSKGQDNLHQEINLFRTVEGYQGGQGFHGLLHPARGILQTIPGNRQQLQSGRKGRAEKLRGKKGDVPALQT